LARWQVKQPAAVQNNLALSDGEIKFTIGLMSVEQDRFFHGLLVQVRIS